MSQPFGFGFHANWRLRPAPTEHGTGLAQDTHRGVLDTSAKGSTRVTREAGRNTLATSVSCGSATVPPTPFP